MTDLLPGDAPVGAPAAPADADFPLASTQIDLREQLYNQRLCGPITEVQLPRERITTLHGLMVDLDPGLLRPDNGCFPPADDPRSFHDRVRPALDRHALAAHAEVRASGTGLHLLVWLDPPAELRSDGEQRYWAGLVDVVRATLPSDPNAPGITALTRPVGSVNGKNGRPVECLRAGRPLPPADVEAFARRVAAAPFKEVAVALFGDTRVAPCPACRRPGSRLDALDRTGRCYGCCGNVRLDQLFDALYRPPAAAGTAA